jgi:hypothetical protein
MANSSGRTGLASFDTVITVWEKAVDTQMHFNEMCVKSRQLGLTFVAAALGVAIFLFTRTDGKYDVSKTICGVDVKFHVAVLIVLAAALAVWAVRILDLNVYHQMLRGAVAFGEDLEEARIKSMLGLEKGMTQAISHFSRNTDAAVEVGSTGSFHYTGKDQKSAQKKIGLFYNVVIGFLIASAGALFFLTNDF